jgi:hypothetical protein
MKRAETARQPAGQPAGPPDEPRACFLAPYPAQAAREEGSTSVTLLNREFAKKTSLFGDDAEFILEVRHCMMRCMQCMHCW